MVDIRPHRRLAVRFEPPNFDDIVDVSDFVSHMYEHFGVACFNSSMFSLSDISVVRRMCDSLGLRMFVDCPDMASAMRAVGNKADFVAVPVDLVSPVSQLSSKARVFASFGEDSDLSDLSDLLYVHGVFCPSSLVETVRQAFPLLSIFSSSGDVISAVKCGAEFAVVDDSVVRSPDPGRAARQLAEDFREFT